ncbi:MAG: Rieske (2Fe-2S) iron-sulfur domain protein [Bacillales bacterium]|jgi:hypothetical protein|nr:Rieske (2Fe-2S) iron-sulfur domain protein [Bacillales bacterium]
MDRIDFLKEMKNSFGETIKGIFSPFLEEKVEKIDDATSILSGEKWSELPPLDTSIEWGVRDFYLGEDSFNLIIQGENIQAFKKQCPTCRGLIVITPFDKKAKCFMCDQSLSLVNFEGDLKVTRSEVKKRNDNWFVQIT